MTETLREIGNIQDSSQGRVTSCLLLPGDDGCITVADDKSLRIWLRREGTSQFWPSVCQYLPSAGTSLYLDNSGEHLLVGTDDGSAYRYEVQQDYNALILQRRFVAHTCAISKISSDLMTVYDKKRSRAVELNKGTDLNKSLVITVGAKDKSVFWFNASDGEKLGVCSSLPDNCTAMAIDVKARSLFLGLNNGMIYQIVLDQLDARKSKLSSKWVAHDKMMVNSLSWCPKTESLISATSENWSSDGGEIKVWFIGGGQGKKINFCAHPAKQQIVSTEMYEIGNKFGLISINQYGKVGKFEWEQKREISDSPTWKEADSCQMCAWPFLWNVAVCWERKTIGRRQHHCRACGSAICANCWNSDKKRIPNLGFENGVNLCKKCNPVKRNEFGNQVSGGDNNPQMFGQTIIEEDGDLEQKNNTLKGYNCGESVFKEFQLGSNSAILSSKIDFGKKWLIVSLNDCSVRIYDLNEVL